MFRPYKFLVVAVIQKLDDDGTVVAELQAEQAAAVFGVDGLRRYADTFELELAAKGEETHAG